MGQRLVDRSGGAQPAPVEDDAAHLPCAQAGPPGGPPACAARRPSPPGARTRPSVTWGRNGRPSGGIPSRARASSTLDASAPRAAPPSPIPAHTTRGRRAVGKAPAPSATTRIGAEGTAAASACTSASRRSSATSPRKRSVRCICAGGVQRTSAAGAAARSSSCRWVTRVRTSSGSSRRRSSARLPPGQPGPTPATSVAVSTTLASSRRSARAAACITSAAMGRPSMPTAANVAVASAATKTS